MSSQRITKVVYLDQKCWINIAKLYFSETPEQESDIVKKLLEVSENPFKQAKKFCKEAFA